MKTLKLILTAVAIFVLASCSNDIDLDLQNENLPYLAIDENADFQNLSSAEQSILSRALQRIRIIRNKDGLIEMTAKKARDINVSESIFRFFKGIIDTSNEYVPCQRNQLISRGVIGEGTDCLVYAIMHATGIMDYYLILGHIERIIGETTEPLTKDLEQIINDPLFIRDLGVAREMNINEFVVPERLSNRIIIIYRDPENMKDAHAVNACYSIFGGYFMVQDYQNMIGDDPTQFVVDPQHILSIIVF